MTGKKAAWTCCVVATLILAVIIGCSDKTFTSSTNSVSQTASPTVYIPLEVGWRINYALLEPQSQFYDVEIANEAVIAGNTGYVVRTTNRSTDKIVYSYIYAKDEAIFESYSLSNPGERILESPFVIGNSWSRLDHMTSGDDPDYGTGGEDDFEIPIDIFGDTYKVIPDEGFTIMAIVGREDVAAMDGHVYGNCIKVAWQTGEESYVYYWYAAGIGLVKYETVNMTTLAASQSNSLSVMTDYQKVVY